VAAARSTLCDREMKRILCFWTMLTMVVGCQHSENRYATRAVTQGELIGSWVATEYAVKSLKDVGVTDHLDRTHHVLVLR
jgi:hypothetical protein